MVCLIYLSMLYGILLEDGENLLKEDSGLLLNEYPQDWILTCDKGAYTLTGKDATLKHLMKLVCAKGSYSYTGYTIILKHFLKLVCVKGVYALTGKATTLKHKMKLVCVKGVYTLTGYAVSFYAKFGEWSITEKPASPSYTKPSKPSTSFTKVNKNESDIWTGINKPN